MNFTWYKSNDDGTVGARLTDGGLNELFSEVTKTQQLNGATVLDKAWSEPDSDGEFWLLGGLANNNPMALYWFQSANDNDTESDLTGNEDRYGRALVVSNTDTSFTVEKDPNHTIWRTDMYVEFSGQALKRISGVTDNGDGTLTIDISTDFSGNDMSGVMVYGLVYINNGTANQKYPIWYETVVPEGFVNDIGESFTTLLIGEY